MNFTKLPSNSERLLLELVQAENPTRLLNEYYERCSIQKRDVLDGIVRELRALGFINVKWADNMPWNVTLNNSARVYSEELSRHMVHNMGQVQQEQTKRNVIFISHRSTDSGIADMLVDFFSGTGIPKEVVFCSSLPGNDINEKISDEVKRALKSSTVNIAILSQEYYRSAYCLNEAGILWYEDIPVIPIALPEINPGNMYGFLNSEYKLRRLDCDTDISYIYDVVSEAVIAPHIKSSVIIRESNKLRAKYMDLLSKRDLQKEKCITSRSISLSEITTDDERIVLYYILQKKIRKVSKPVLVKWLNESEIYDVDIDNAFDLLSSFEGGTVINDVLELGIEAFRKYSSSASDILPDLKLCVDQHTKLAVNTFKTVWNSIIQDSTMGMLVAYIVDERIRLFGDRWMANGQIEDIKRWESKNSLYSMLSESYGSCLEFLVQNDLVYASGWTSYGNTKEYSLCPSLQQFLFNCPSDIAMELQKIKEKHYCVLPF